MRRSCLGRSGLTTGAVALGTLTWGTRTPPDEARGLLARFLDAGGDLVDTAHTYGDGASETILGGLLADVGRDAVTVCTKAGISRTSGRRVVDVSRRGLMAQLDTSLARLATDHVDLWLAHTWSDSVPLEETIGALEWAWRSGRARYVGVSNYAGWQLARAYSLAETARMPLVADQVEYSLLERVPEHELVPAAASLGVGLMAWSPLGGGILTGKYRDSTPADSRGASAAFAGMVQSRLGEANRGVVDAVGTAARGLETTPAALSLAWLLARPAVACAVVGCRTERQLAQVLVGLDTVVPNEIRLALDEVSLGSL